MVRPYDFDHCTKDNILTFIRPSIRMYPFSSILAMFLHEVWQREYHILCLFW